MSAPAPATVTASVELPQPPELVWRAATDWPRQGEWMLATRVELTGGDGASVGSTARAVTGIGPLGVSDPFEIVEWTAPPGGTYRCVVAHTGPAVRGRGVFEVAPNGAGGSRFSWSERLELPLGALGRLGWPVAALLARAGLATSLRRFARHCCDYR